MNNNNTTATDPPAGGAFSFQESSRSPRADDVAIASMTSSYSPSLPRGGGGGGASPRAAVAVGGSQQSKHTNINNNNNQQQQQQQIQDPHFYNSDSAGEEQHRQPTLLRQTHDIVADPSSSHPLPPPRPSSADKESLGIKRVDSDHSNANAPPATGAASSSSKQHAAPMTTTTTTTFTTSTTKSPAHQPLPLPPPPPLAKGGSNNNNVNNVVTSPATSPRQSTLMMSPTNRFLAVNNNANTTTTTVNRSTSSNYRVMLMGGGGGGGGDVGVSGDDDLYFSNSTTAADMSTSKQRDGGGGGGGGGGVITVQSPLGSDDEGDLDVATETSKRSRAIRSQQQQQQQQNKRPRGLSAIDDEVGGGPHNELGKGGGNATAGTSFKVPLVLIFSLQCFLVIAAFVSLIVMTSVLMDSATRKLVEQTIGGDLSFARARILSPLQQYEKAVLQLRQSYLSKTELNGGKDICADSEKFQDSEQFFLDATVVIKNNPLVSYAYHLRRSDTRRHPIETDQFDVVECDVTPWTIAVINNNSRITTVSAEFANMTSLDSLPYEDDPVDYFYEEYVPFALSFTRLKWSPYVYYDNASDTTELYLSAYAPLRVQNTYADGRVTTFEPNLFEPPSAAAEEAADDPPVESVALATYGIDVGLTSFIALMKHITPDARDKKNVAHTSLYDRIGGMLVCTSDSAMPLFSSETGEMWPAGQTPSGAINSAFRHAFSTFAEGFGVGIGDSNTYASLEDEVDSAAAGSAEPNVDYDSDPDSVISTIAVRTTSGIDFVIVQSTPKKYYFDAITSLRTSMIIVGVIAAVLVVLVCVAIGLWIKIPLANVAKNMALAAVMKNDRVASTSSLLSEVSLLCESFDRMNAKLLMARAFMPQAMLISDYSEDDLSGGLSGGEGEDDDDDSDDAEADHDDDEDGSVWKRGARNNNNQGVMDEHTSASDATTDFRSVGTSEVGVRAYGNKQVGGVGKTTAAIAVGGVPIKRCRANNNANNNNKLHYAASTAPSSTNTTASTAVPMSGLGGGGVGGGGPSLVTKRVTILVINTRHFHSRLSLSVPSSVFFPTTELTALLHAICQQERGVIDSFHGDRFILSFNAVKTNAQGPVKAVRSAMQLMQNDLVLPSVSNSNPNTSNTNNAAIPQQQQRTSGNFNINLSALNASSPTSSSPISFTMGVSVGKAIVGHLGTATLKRLSIVGKVYSRAVGLERVARLVGEREDGFVMRRGVAAAAATNTHHPSSPLSSVPLASSSPSSSLELLHRHVMTQRVTEVALRGGSGGGGNNNVNNRGGGGGGGANSSSLSSSSSSSSSATCSSSCIIDKFVANEISHTNAIILQLVGVVGGSPFDGPNANAFKNGSAGVGVAPPISPRALLEARLAAETNTDISINIDTTAFNTSTTKGSSSGVVVGEKEEDALAAALLLLQQQQQQQQPLNFCYAVRPSVAQLTRHRNILRGGGGGGGGGEGKMQATVSTPTDRFAAAASSSGFGRINSGAGGASNNNNNNPSMTAKKNVMPYSTSYSSSSLQMLLGDLHLLHHRHFWDDENNPTNKNNYAIDDTATGSTSNIIVDRNSNSNSNSNSNNNAVVITWNNNESGSSTAKQSYPNTNTTTTMVPNTNSTVNINTNNDNNQNDEWLYAIQDLRTNANGDALLAAVNALMEEAIPLLLLMQQQQQQQLLLMSSSGSGAEDVKGSSPAMMMAKVAAAMGSIRHRLRHLLLVDGQYGTTAANKPTTVTAAAAASLTATVPPFPSFPASSSSPAAAAAANVSPQQLLQQLWGYVALHHLDLMCDGMAVAYDF